MSQKLSQKLNIWWLRRDFRLNDNPALYYCLQQTAKDPNSKFLPIFCLDDSILKSNNLGLIRRRYLASLLQEFSNNFDNFCIFYQSPVKIFEALSKFFEVRVFFNQDLEPYSRIRDKQVSQVVKTHIFSDYISVPLKTFTGQGNLYSVFTPFKKKVCTDFLKLAVLPIANWRVLKPDQNLDWPKIKSQFPGLPDILDTNTLEQFIDLNSNNLVINIAKDEVFNVDLKEIGVEAQISSWYKNEAQALSQFQDFLTNISEYKTKRDFPGLYQYTSKMSVALKWGLVSARLLKQEILKKTNGQAWQDLNAGQEAFLSELIWREFYRYILYHYPQVLNLEFQSKYQNLNIWADQKTSLSRFLAWTKGQTGYPLVDAGLGEIKQTGWMHNRMRMVVASVLTKNLGIDWRWGQSFFEAVLLDLDLASNNGGWQWAASVGSDPKPIRIFNPYLQAQKYDPDFSYQKQWLDRELYQIKTSNTGKKSIDYKITPIVEHSQARTQALARYGLSQR